MVFTKDSYIVRVWVNLINEGKKTLTDVPKLFNLQDAVKEALNE